MYFVLALFLVGTIALLAWQWWTPFEGGVDENGYLVAGRTLAERGRLALVPAKSPGGECSTFVGDMWVGADVGTPRERYYPKYPPGFPLLVAVCWKIGGIDTGRTLAYLLNPLGYCVALLGIFALTRALVSSFAGVVAIVCVVLSAPVMRLFNVPGSHGISIALLAWAAFILVRWLDEGRWWQAIVVGVLSGYAAIVRSGEGILVLPLLVALALNWKDRRRLLQGIAMLGIWALPVAAAALAQKAATGSWTGYATTGEDSAFGFSYLIANARYTLEGLLESGFGFMFPLGLAGLILLAWHRRNVGIVLLVWVLANVLVYAFYYWAPNNDLVIRGRFNLPSYGPAVAGTLFLVVSLARCAAPGARWLANTAVIIISLGSIAYVLDHGLAWARTDVIAKLNLEERLVWVQERIEPDAVLLCDETDMLDHLQFASNLTLHDFRPFNEQALQYLVDNDRLNSLDRHRRKYLRERYLSLRQAGMIQLRDQMISGYIARGRKVYAFEGPRRAFLGWGSLKQHGLVATRIGDYKSSETFGFPNVAMDGVLYEIVRK